MQLNHDRGYQTMNNVPIFASHEFCPCWKGAKICAFFEMDCVTTSYAGVKGSSLLENGQKFVRFSFFHIPSYYYASWGISLSWASLLLSKRSFFQLVDQCWWMNFLIWEKRSELERSNDMSMVGLKAACLTYFFLIIPSISILILLATAINLMMISCKGYWDKSVDHVVIEGC